VVTMSILTAGSTENQLMIFSNIFPPQWIDEPFRQPAPSQGTCSRGSQVRSGTYLVPAHMKSII
jgi:hypothetical protein